jgi:hypothetical protein
MRCEYLSRNPQRSGGEAVRCWRWQCVLGADIRNRRRLGIHWGSRTAAESPTPPSVVLAAQPRTRRFAGVSLQSRLVNLGALPPAPPCSGGSGRRELVPNQPAAGTCAVTG